MQRAQGAAIKGTKMLARGTKMLENVLDDGYRDYLQVEYGSADMYNMPVVDQEVTVRYHDKHYGETDNVDDAALAIAAFQTSFPDVHVLAEGEDADEFDGVDTPGHVELGDEHTPHSASHARTPRCSK